MTKIQTTSEWSGIRGSLNAWALASSLIRRIEMLFVGNYRSAYLNEIFDIIKEDDVVLEIGAGSGCFSLPIAKKLKTGKLICLDLSEEMLQYLKRKAEKERLNDRIEIINAEASSSGLPNEAIDLAISSFLFHELSNTEAVLTEIFRILKTNGRIIITDFKSGSWLGKRIAFDKGNAHGPYTANELDIFFSNAGLSSVKVSTIKNYILGVGIKLE